MGNNVMIFEGNGVEIIEIDGQIMFELYSTGRALGQVKIAKGKEYPRKDRIDKCIINAEISTVVHGGQQYLTESQLYDFMLEARTDKCKVFRKWVTDEVLPQIRQTGGFVDEGREEEFIDKYFPSFSDEVKLAMTQDLYKKNQEYKSKIKELEVVEDKYNIFLNSDKAFTMNQVAKTFAIKRLGRNNMFELLRDKKVLRYNNEPYQSAIDKEYFKVIMGQHWNGIQTLITAKGVDWLYKMLTKYGYTISKSKEDILEELVG